MELFWRELVQILGRLSASHTLSTTALLLIEKMRSFFFSCSSSFVPKLILFKEIWTCLSLPKMRSCFCLEILTKHCSTLALPELVAVAVALVLVQTQRLHPRSTVCILLSIIVLHSRLLLSYGENFCAVPRTQIALNGSWVNCWPFLLWKSFFEVFSSLRFLRKWQNVNDCRPISWLTISLIKS